VVGLFAPPEPQPAPEPDPGPGAAHGCPRPGRRVGQSRGEEPAPADAADEARSRRACAGPAPPHSRPRGQPDARSIRPSARQPESSS
jgi:hypothetical protein